MSGVIKQAVVLAGGRGTRLRPYTISLPKPLVPVGHYPVAEYIVGSMARAGIADIVFAVNHQADVIQAYFGDGRRWGVSIRYHVEPEPRGTMGALRDIADVDDRFLVLNGDILSDLDFTKFSQSFLADGSPMGLVAIPQQVVSEYGEITLAPSGRLHGFVEKPVNHRLISGGIYAMNRSALACLEPDESVGADTVIGRLLAREDSIFVFPHAGLWLDLGRPADFDVANGLADGGALNAIIPRRISPSPNHESLLSSSRNPLMEA